MISLIILSHSLKIAEGTRELALEMGGNTRIHDVGGTKDGSLGADYDSTLEVLTEALENGGEAIVLADMGSTRMTVQMACETLDEEMQKRVFLSNAALVEGAVVAAVSIGAGLSVQEILEQLKEFELNKD